MSKKFISGVLFCVLVFILIYFIFIKPSILNQTSNLATVVLSENEKQAMVRNLAAQIDARQKIIAGLQSQIAELLKPTTIESTTTSTSVPQTIPPTTPTPPITPPPTSPSPAPVTPPPTTTNSTVSVVIIAPANSSITKGQTVQLTATIKNALGQLFTSLPVTWASSNESVAKVSSSGLVTAGDTAGTATITGSRDSGRITGSATVTVSNP